MEIAIVLLIITIIGVMFWSVTVSRHFSIMVFTVIFIGVAIAMILWQGFTQQAFENLGVLAFIFLIGWLRFSKSIAETSAARSGLEENSTCEICGQKLSYHRMPKNVGQLLLGGLTCKNCGAEFDVSLDRLMPK
jgi:hypothetical protein